MIPKYTIEYTARTRDSGPARHYGTDDPVACEGLIKELLEDGFRIVGIKHEGLDLPRAEFDRLVKTAAAMGAAERICSSLGIKAEEEKYRFGFGL
jgi:hypothetical protein